MKRSNIVFIGMPASGKTTLAKYMSKKLGWKFIDTDRIIEDEQGKKLKEIISEVGNDRFLEIENDVNSRISGEHMVIAPGGSVIFGKEAMENFRKIGVVIYLKTSYYTIQNRIGDPVARGVILENGETIKDVYNKRRKYFEKYAHLTFTVKNTSIKSTILRLIKTLNEKGYILE